MPCGTRPFPYSARPWRQAYAPLDVKGQAQTWVEVLARAFVAEALEVQVEVEAQAGAQAFMEETPEEVQVQARTVLEEDLVESVVEAVALVEEGLLAAPLEEALAEDLEVLALGDAALGEAALGEAARGEAALAEDLEVASLADELSSKPSRKNKH